jgi:hypothetical protein
MRVMKRLCGGNKRKQKHDGKRFLGNIIVSKI